MCNSDSSILKTINCFRIIITNYHFFLFITALSVSAHLPCDVANVVAYQAHFCAVDAYKTTAKINLLSAPLICDRSERPLM